MSGWKAKRFWKEATVEETQGGWTVRLDARPVKTPAKAPLVLPTRAMAEAVAAGDRRALARAITLVESGRADHRAAAAEMLARLARGGRQAD